MPQLDSDAFAYSAGALVTVSSGKWTDGTFPATQTVGGSVTEQVGSTGSDAGAIITSWSGSTTDHYSQVDMVSVTPSGEGGVILRGNSGDDQIVVDFVTGDVCYVFERINGTYNQVGDTLTFNDTITTGDVLYADIQGSIVTVKQNGVSLGTRSNSWTVTSGVPGIWSSGGGSSFLMDNWVAGDFSGGGGGTDPSFPSRAIRPAIFSPGLAR